MIYKDGENAVIEKRKERLGITGDVYIYDDHFIENLEGHKAYIGESSTATTIEEAYEERVTYEAEQQRLREEAAARAAEEEEQEEMTDGETE